MNTKLDIFLDVQMNNKTNEEIARLLTLSNRQNVKFKFVQIVENKLEFYVEGSSRSRIDAALSELGFNRSSKDYEDPEL